MAKANVRAAAIRAAAKAIPPKDGRTVPDSMVEWLIVRGFDAEKAGPVMRAFVATGYATAPGGGAWGDEPAVPAPSPTPPPVIPPAPAPPPVAPETPPVAREGKP